MPVGAVRVGAVLEQEDAVLAAVGGDLIHLEGDVAADVHQHAGARALALGLALEVRERHAQVLAVAIHEHRATARLEDRQRGGHEGV